VGHCGSLIFIIKMTTVKVEIRKENTNPSKLNDSRFVETTVLAILLVENFNVHTNNDVCILVGTEFVEIKMHMHRKITTNTNEFNFNPSELV
jgi:hypothetical protein